MMAPVKISVHIIIILVYEMQYFFNLRVTSNVYSKYYLYCIKKSATIFLSGV